MVEFALILPLMLLLLAGAVDLGRLFYTYIGMQNAAREGVAYAIFHAPDAAGDPPPISQITLFARQEMGGNEDLAVSASCPAGDCTATDTLPGNKISVTVSLTFSFITPFIPTMDLSASSTAVILQKAATP